MKRIGMSIFALTCCVALSLPCVAQANPWSGSWKLEAGSMKYDGPTFSLKTDADGITVTRYGKASPKMICDGQPHPDTGGVMLTCVKSGSAVAVNVSKDGKPLEKITFSLSDGGRMETRTAEIYPASGPSYKIVTEAKRTSGGSGWDGEWKEVNFKESQDSGILSIDVHGDMVAFKETDNDKPIDCKLDGTPTKAGGGSMAVKMDGSHTLKVTYSGANGKVQRSNTFVLSEDGNTIHETDVTPMPSPSTMSETFHKS